MELPRTPPLSLLHLEKARRRWRWADLVAETEAAARHEPEPYSSPPPRSC